MSDSSRPDGRGVRELAPKPRWGRRIFKGFLVLLLLLVAAHWGWGRYARSQMEAELQRYRAAGEPIDPADFREDAPPDDQNAAVDLLAAGELIDGSAEDWRKINYCDTGLPLDDQELGVIEKMLHNSRDALRRLNTAMDKPKAHWKRDSVKPVYATSNPWSACTRDLPGLLRLAALRAHQLGDDRQAMTRVRQLFFIARSVDRDALLAGHVMAMGIRSTACDAILRIAAALAIRCYAVTHNGRLPEDLDDLVPAILPILPADLMAWGGRRLGYHPDAANPILYSVGKERTTMARLDRRLTSECMQATGVSTGRVAMPWFTWFASRA